MVFRKIRRGGAKGAVDVEGGHMVFRKLGGGGERARKGRWILVVITWFSWPPRSDKFYRQQLKCSSMRKLSNLSPFGNLSHGVFFSVDLLFRRRRPMNITSTIPGNPSFHHIKTVLC